MENHKVLHTIGGDGEASYAANSNFQKDAIMKAAPFVKDAILDYYNRTFPKILRIAELGCGPGSNSLLAASQIIHAINSTCQIQGCTTPEFQIFLNDLPGNDFNNVFKHVPYFLEEIRQGKEDVFRPCFIAGVPGSYYGRLFPERTLHFVHSSYSVHYLSQVPQGIENNKGSVYISRTSPANVPAAYWAQFRKDFTLFLNSRSEEILPGGQMVITMLGRKNSDPCSKECCYFWDLLAQSLCDLISQGIVEEAKLDSFNVPVYYPSRDEIRTLIQEERSFRLDCLEMFDMDVETYKGLPKQELVATIRALTKSVIASHFGEVTEDLFSKYAENVEKYLEEEDIKLVTLLLCMTKKD